MNTIPKPLLTRLVLIFLIGTGCLFVGIAGYLYAGDNVFLVLSLILFAAHLIKGISFLFLLFDHAYDMLEGTCIQIKAVFFGRTRQITISCLNGEHLFYLNKRISIHIGRSYRFYFRKQGTPLQPAQKYLKRQWMNSHFLGVEEYTSPAIQDAPYPVSFEDS